MGIVRSQERLAALMEGVRTRSLGQISHACVMLAGSVVAICETPLSKYKAARAEGRGAHMESIESKVSPDINYALVEEVRPPMYRAMKYWGKKPHNIWSAYIERYCPPGGVVLDPFVGSGIAAFEAAKLGRRSIALDLNPLSGFFIETISTPLNEEKFTASYEAIVATIERDNIYINNYITSYEGARALIQNYRWLNKEVAEVVLEKDDGQIFRIPARGTDKALARGMAELVIPYWHPTDKFPNTPSINHKFISDLGGDQFNCLWTKRNLYILSHIFDEICRIRDKATRLHLVSAFIQTLHLTFRMVYPRSVASNRDSSGSWGRADYMIRRKEMEQNPLLIFKRSCVGRQGVLPMLRDAQRFFPNGVTAVDVTNSKKIKPRALINYGTADIADLDQFVADKRIDFIITDPPYAGLVHYLDLSLVWLVWLKHLDKRRFTPDLRSGITIKKGQVGREEYRRKLINAFKQLHRVLKDDGKLVITFHHQDVREWNEFVNAVRLSGFTFEKVTHQYNRRSGESNVSNPYGTSGTDFYIRCVKRGGVDFSNDASGLEHFIVEKTIEIIARRNEPTPYKFIFDGLVPELLQAGMSHLDNSRSSVEQILHKYEGKAKIFVRHPNETSKAGEIWWFNNPSTHISHPDRPLRDRVEETILALLRRKVSVRFDDVLAELFREYPNGLTPDVRTVPSILETYAYRSAGRWKIKDLALSEATKHTEMLEVLLKMGLRSGVQTFIGRREQPEPCSFEHGKVLREIATCTSLDSVIGLDQVRRARAEMIDQVWLSVDKRSIVAIFEVENSTNFTSGIQRASNLDHELKKFMVIPDSRKDELLRIRDPLFVSAFKEQNWRYLTYTDVVRLANSRKIGLEEITLLATEL